MQTFLLSSDDICVFVFIIFVCSLYLNSLYIFIYFLIFFQSKLFRMTDPIYWLSYLENTKMKKGLYTTNQLTLIVCVFRQQCLVLAPVWSNDPLLTLLFSRESMFLSMTFSSISLVKPDVTKLVIVLAGRVLGIIENYKMFWYTEDNIRHWLQ